MIDVHSHLLPGIDDGSRSVEQSEGVLGMFAEQGISDVVLTPHVTASQLAADPEAAVDRRETALLQLRNAGIETPQLHLGFEIMLDQPLSPLSIGDRRFSLAGSRYFLVEFPFTVAPGVAGNVLAKIAEVGVVPVVAHPERYQECSSHAVAQWRDVGAKMQIDATCLTRTTARGHRARQLLAAGLGDLIAADNHGNQRVLTTGVRYLEERHAQIEAGMLSVLNPTAIIADGQMSPVPPVRLKESLLGRWTRFMGR